MTLTQGRSVKKKYSIPWSKGPQKIPTLGQNAYIYAQLCSSIVLGYLEPS
jgi:hypothetical protein